jgi:hypothetical protein
VDCLSAYLVKQNVCHDESSSGAIPEEIREIAQNPLAAAMNDGRGLRRARREFMPS